MCSSTGSAVCHKGPTEYTRDLSFAYTCPRGANVNFVAWAVAELNVWSTLSATLVGPPPPAPAPPQCTDRGDPPTAAVLAALSPLLLAIATHLFLTHVLSPSWAHAARGALYHSLPLAGAPFLSPNIS